MRIAFSRIGLLFLLLGMVPMVEAQGATLYERMRSRTNTEFMLDGVEGAVSGFVSSKTVFNVDPRLDAEEINLAAQGNEYEMCRERYDTGVCSLAPAIAKVAKRENRVRTFGRDLQLIAGGYELPIDDFPSHGLPFAPRLPSIIKIWQSSNDWMVTPVTEHRVRVVPLPGELAELRSIFAAVESLASYAAVWRYRYGLYAVQRERGDDHAACAPPYSTPDGTELQQIRRCHPGLEAALKTALFWVLEHAEHEFDPPLEAGEIVLFPPWAINNREMFVWIYTDRNMLKNFKAGTADALHPPGEIGLGFEMPIEPVLPALTCQGSSDPSCFDGAILGGVYPPDPPEPGVGEKLCALPFSSLGYLCRPLDQPDCSNVSESDCELNIFCNSATTQYNCYDDAKTFPKEGNTIPICLPDNSPYPLRYLLLRELEEARHRCNLPAGAAVGTNMRTCCTLERSKAAAMCEAYAEDGNFDGTNITVSTCTNVLANMACADFVANWTPKTLGRPEYDPTKEEIECSAIRYESDIERGVMVCTEVESWPELQKSYNRIDNILRNNNRAGHSRSCQAALNAMGQKVQTVIDSITGGTECKDGIDNDGDGYIDYRPDGMGDPECYSPDTNREAPECSDGIDNDGDGYIDYPDDLSCTSPEDDSEADLVLRSCYLTGSKYIGLETVSGPDVCRVGTWHQYTGLTIRNQEVVDTTSRDDEINGPYDCAPCALDFFCGGQCDPTPDDDDDNPPVDYPRSFTYPKERSGVIPICLPNNPRIPATYSMIHELTKAQKSCGLPPDTLLIDDLESCCNIEWEANMAVCSAIEQDGNAEGTDFSITRCASTLTNLVCAPYSNDFRYFHTKENMAICAPVKPAKLLEDYEKIVDIAKQNNAQVATACADAIGSEDERVKNMMQTMLYSCSPECRVEYWNTIGNNLCYIGQCIEESMELQRLLPGRMALNIPDQAFPWDAELKDNPLIGAVLPTPPLPFTRLPDYRPGLLAKQLDLSLCQINALPLQSPPQKCNFNALRQLTIAPPIAAFVGAGLLSQEGEQFQEAWKVHTLATSVGTRIGSTLYAQYLDRAGKSLSELVNTANELLGGLANIRFPSQMCPRRDG